MEHSMRLVETHCSKYLDMFGECIKQYPHTWQMDCEQERRKLAKCAETNPEIVQIKTACGNEFQMYEKCMADNRVDPEKCSEFFSAFSTCADAALDFLSTSAKSTESKTIPCSGNPASESEGS